MAIEPLLRVIDCETTGADHTVHEVIEIGSVDYVRSDVIFCNISQRYVKPKRDIPPESSAIHHIVAEDVKDAAEYAEAISHFFGADIYVAHNARFEQQFLPELGPWLCTYKAALRHWVDKAPGFSNQTLRYWLGFVSVPVFGRTVDVHRSVPDAAVTACILHRLLLEGCTIEEMLKWANEPAILPRIPFGKHKGKLFSEIPTDYLDWIVSKSSSDMSEDVIATAHFHLNARRSNSTP